jgi:integrase
MLFGLVVDEVLRDVAPLLRESTQELYFIYLGELKIELGLREISTFTRADYMEWMRSFKLRKDRKTFFDYTKFINIIFRFAYQQKYLVHWMKFPSVDGEREPSWRVYTQTEIGALDSAMGLVTRTQFCLSYECFMRLREVLYLSWDRVDLENRTITLRKVDVKTGKKQRRGRVVPLSPNAWAYLSILRRESVSDYVFPSPGNPYAPVHENRAAWKRAKDLAGIRGKARWHDLRHTSLSHAVMVLRLPLAHISKVAGVSIKTLERVYVHGYVEDVRWITEKMSIVKKVV